MKKILLCCLFISITNISFCQNDSVIAVGLTPSEFAPLCFVDGLKLDTLNIVNLDLQKYCVKKIKLNSDFESKDSIIKYSGKIEIFTKCLLDLDGILINNSRDKIKILYTVQSKDIKNISFIKKENAILLYGKKGKFGVIKIILNKKK
ncbi:MAG: hypothetical protein LBN95_02500 [Prevotellaceae bacterium]|jgi:hypothetical protein|nr:hypothetical protein [Prevotellaceae bacterium]